MQDVTHNEGSDGTKDPQIEDDGQPNVSPSSSPGAEKSQNLPQVKPDIFADLSHSDEDEGSEVESFIIDQDIDEDSSRFLLSSETLDEDGDMRTVDPETQARLEALLEAAGIGKLSTADGKAFADPEVLRRLTSSVSCALDEAAAALTRMRAEQQAEGTAPADSTRSLAKACSSGDIGTVRQLLDEGRSVHETTEEGESLLSLACSAGYYELAQVLLAMRANVEDRGIKGDCTPLMEAASGGYVDIVRLLIAHGADVNAQSSAGNTPLHYAACGGHEEVVKVLIEFSANVEEHNENGHTPLMEAASAGHVGVASILLESGAGINTHSNEFKESALTLACYKGHLEMVKFLLEAGADHEHKTDEMHTALMEACMDGHVDVARLLLDSGAQVNMPIDSFESPLTLAACGGHVELANLLIERGANLEEVNDEGYTPLMEAAREGHEDMVALLLAHGADINGQTEETQETALTLACCGGFQEVADFLIKAGADLELGCSTPLMEAAQEGHLELVKYLIKVGANVHAQTQTGDTALTYACENGHTDVAEVLLDAGAELEHESEGGRTPLMKAARAGHLCTVQFLIGKGADVNRATSTSDHTVLSLACAGGHLTVVELLLRHGSDSAHKLKDGSTMLIEAAKGGHTSVVNLLLDWPSSILSPNQATDLSHLASPAGMGLGAEHMELPRVPVHGLANIVPPQDPNQVNHHQQQLLNAAAVNFVPNFSQAQSLPGEVNLKDFNIPRHAIEQIPQVTFEQNQEYMRQLAKNKQRAVACINNGGIASSADAINGSGNGSCAGDHNGTGQICSHVANDASDVVVVPSAIGISSSSVSESAKNTSNNAVNSEDNNSQMTSSQISDIDSDFSADFERSYTEGGSPVSLDLEDKQICDMKASDRLEAFINKMMQKAELLNTTREEQILKKQQILEELQKVGNLLLDSVPKSRQQQSKNSPTSTSDDSNCPNDVTMAMAMSMVDHDLSLNVEKELQEKAKQQFILSAQQKAQQEKLRKKQRQLLTQQQQMALMEAAAGNTSSGVPRDDLEASLAVLSEVYLEDKEPNCQDGGGSAADAQAAALAARLTGDRNLEVLNREDHELYMDEEDDDDLDDEDDDEEDDDEEDDDEESQLGEADMCLIHDVEEIDMERLNNLDIDDLDGQRLAERLNNLEEEVGRLNNSLGIVDGVSLVEGVKKLKISGRENASLTCAPNPVPLHIALKNDLEVQLQQRLRDVTATTLAQDLFINSPGEITKMVNDSPASPPPCEDESKSLNNISNTTQSPSFTKIQESSNRKIPAEPSSGGANEAARLDHRKHPQLAKQESVSSIASSADSGCAAASDPQFPFQGEGGDSLVLPDEGTSVDPNPPLPFLTPPTGSPVRENSEESNQSNSSSKSQSSDESNSHQSSRASSEEVDLSNVVPRSELHEELTAHQHHPQLQQQQQHLTKQQLQLLQQQLQQHQLLQHKLALAKDKKINKNMTVSCTTQTLVTNNPNNATSVIVQNPQQLQHLQNLMTIPLQLEPFTAQAITPANAAAIQQQLEQQRQQLQAQLALQQQLQHELQQQLKLQQEHEQLKQQLKQHQHQVALQQKQIQQPGNGNAQNQLQGGKGKGNNNNNQVKVQQSSSTVLATTTTLESLQQEINQQELQQLKLQQVQQHLQQLHQQLQQVQQLQNNHQLTQQELLQQAQQLQQQLQVAQMQQFAVQTQPLQAAAAAQIVASSAVQTCTGGVGLQAAAQSMPINQMAQLFTQQDLLQQAQQLQQLAQLQRQQNQLQNMPRSSTMGMANMTNITPAMSTIPVCTLPSGAVATAPINNQMNVNVNVNINTCGVATAGGLNVAAKKAKKKLFNPQTSQQGQGQQTQLVVQQPPPPPPVPLQAIQQPTQQQIQQHQLQQQQLQQLQALQQQQYQQQLQQQQLYQLQQQQYQQQQVQLLQQNPQLQNQLQNPQFAQQLAAQYTTPVANNQQQLYDYYLDLINPPPSTPMTPNPSPASPQISPPNYPSVELDAQTESNHDTALTLACAGGHAELVSLLLSRGADIEHRDKKGFTPLILASTAGHLEIVEVLLDHQADIEAQSERTKDTPLSLACSGGRYEVVELLLNRGANKEHRNVSDYTPLSLAASGGYVNIIKLLLSHGAEINSRTGSKLGISPLMLAAMNGHTAAVKLLLDMGSDINAQIETNRNTALTLACFQGRHEVVSLLVDRKANIEHRAKTGLTPLMEAASGGYVEVGRVLLDKGADVNATPVPSSRDTALTIAADKGHYRFVELLIQRGAMIDVKNKKGNSPLWLACNGGHLDVVQLLVNGKADVDSQDNRKVSCLMAAFRKGHIKVVKWMVKHVTQFPSDQECMRFIQTVTDKELLKKCHQCMEIIVSAKDRQAAEANKNASILLEEIDAERSREETKRERAARKREKRRMKKKEKQEKERCEKEEKEREEREKEEAEQEKREKKQRKQEIKPSSDIISNEASSSLDKERKNKKNRETSSDNLKAVNDAKNLSSSTSSTASVDSSTGVVNNNNGTPINNNAAKTKKKKGSKGKQAPITLQSQTPSTLQGQNSNEASMLTGPSSSNVKLPPSQQQQADSRVLLQHKNNNRDNIEKSSGLSIKTTNKIDVPTKLSEKRQKMIAAHGEKREHHSNRQGTSSSGVIDAQKVVEKHNNSKNTGSGPLPNGLDHRAGSEGITTKSSNKKKYVTGVSTSGISDLDDFDPPTTGMGNLKITPSKTPRKEQSQKSNATPNKNNRLNAADAYQSLGPSSGTKQNMKGANTPSPKKGGRREEGWKEVIRKSKKVVVPSNAVTRVIGRAGANINAIREVSGANIEIDKAKGAADRNVTIKGSADATKRAFDLITAMIKDPDKEIEQIIPKMKGKVVNTNTLTISSNVWHNSMANNIVITSGNVLSNSNAQAGGVSAVATPSSQQKAQAGKTGVNSGVKAVTTATRLSSAVTVSVTMSTSRGSIMNGPINGGKSQIVQPPMGAFQVTNGTAIWGNPGQPPVSGTSVLLQQQQQRNMFNMSAAVTTGLNFTPEKSPSMVAKQLFNDNEGGISSNTSSLNTPLRGTYSSPSMAKTKLVATSSPAFSTRVDASTPSPKVAVGSKRLTASQAQQMQQAQAASSQAQQAQQRSQAPGPIGRPMQGVPSYMQPPPQQQQQTPNRPMPQPLPIKTTEGYRQGGKGADYSPFNNFFSQVTEGILGNPKKDEMLENRMNFASVAAAGVVASTSGNVAPIAAPAVSMNELDPSKAPGYKAPGHRTQSPQVPEGPGFKGHLSANAAMSRAQQEGFINMNHPAAVAFMNHHPDFSRIPDFNRMNSGGMSPYGGVGQEFAKAPGFNKPHSGPPSQSMSPRSSASTPMSMIGDQSPRGSRANIGALRTDEEYSSPNTPMTLPKIESNLNPNAPHFMSRTPHGSMNTPPPMPVGHGPVGQQPLPPGTPPLQQPSVHPAFRPSYPTGPSTSSSSQQQLQLGGLTMNDLQSLPMQDLQALLALNSGGFMGAGMNMGRGGSPLTVSHRGHNGGSKDDLSGPNLSASDGLQQQPPSGIGLQQGMRSNALSLEHLGLPRPIGTERGHKRANTPTAHSSEGFLPDLDDLSAPGLWGGYTGMPDIPPEWLSSVSSTLVTTTVMSTTNIVTTSSLDHGRPHSQPAFNTTSVLPGGYLNAGSLEQQQLSDQGLQQSQRSMFMNPHHSGGAPSAPSLSSVFAANGGLGMSLPSVGGRGGGGSDGLGGGGSSMWQNPLPPAAHSSTSQGSASSKVDSSGSGSSLDSKLGWTWPAPSSNA